MKKDICSIPVSEVFEPKEGCPLCRLTSMLEQRIIEYTLGPSMMEPDVRIQTNRLGFCYSHFELLLKQRNRLGLALILESHLEEIKKSLTKKINLNSCFICENITDHTKKILNTMYVLYNKEPQFRKLFSNQQCLCLPHFDLLLKGSKLISKKLQKQFLNDLRQLCLSYLDKLIHDIHHFCTMFDYRNSEEDADWGDSKDAIERAIWFLTSNKVLK